jgi:penicillin-binding protein 2
VKSNREFSYEPATVAEGLTAADVLAFEEVRDRYPELAVASRPVRSYPGGMSASHLLGYVGEIDRRRLADLRRAGYHLGDDVGLAGVEESYERYLRGRDGYERVEVNALEKKLGLRYAEDVVAPRAGYDVHLTLDAEVERLAEGFLAGRRGAIVVMDPQTGDVWALASSPGYNPNDFVGGIDRAKWVALAGAEDHPLLNRAIQCSYPPGSTFKLVTATAALAEGVVKPDEKMPQPCGGVFRFGRWLFHCWNPAGHGPLDMAGGLRNSCNVFFFQVGMRVGIDSLNKYAQVYGYGRKTGVKLAHENAGRIPDRARLERRWGQRWPRGEILNNAIGQGQVLLTPIQEIVAFSAFANGGRLMTPRLVTHVTGAEGQVRWAFPPRARDEVKLTPTARTTILRGLLGVANRFGPNPHYVAGKTGSAENPFGKTHAWFTGFAPAYAPRVAVCILVENGGYGESYIKWADQLIAYCRAHVVTEERWPPPPGGLTPQELERALGPAAAPGETP